VRPPRHGDSNLRLAIQLQSFIIHTLLTPGSEITLPGGSMPSHRLIAFDFSQAWMSLVKIVLTYLLTFPVGWEREREAHSVGVRTFPIVAIASCGYVLLVSSADLDYQTRVLQGLIAGIGFVGGGAILKEGTNVRGTATAATIWGTGVVGAAVAMGRYEIAVILSVLNFLTLKLFWRYKQKLTEGPATPEEGKNERRG
jgi:putative Mg2+ transporter-C (MgtC) family protein